MKRLLLFLAPLALLSCAKDCPEAPLPPPGYGCGPIKMFCTAHKDEGVGVWRRTMLTPVPSSAPYEGPHDGAEPRCTAYTDGSLTVVDTEGTQALVRYTRSDRVPWVGECQPNETYFLSVCEFFELTRAQTVREADRRKLLQTTPSQ